MMIASSGHNYAANQGQEIASQPLLEENERALLSIRREQQRVMMPFQHTTGVLVAHEKDAFNDPFTDSIFDVEISADLWNTGLCDLHQITDAMAANTTHHRSDDAFFPEPTPIGNSGIQIVDSLPMSSSPLRNEVHLVQDLYRIIVQQPKVRQSRGLAGDSIYGHRNLDIFQDPYPVGTEQNDTISEFLSRTLNDSGHTPGTFSQGVAFLQQSPGGNIDLYRQAHETVLANIAVPTTIFASASASPSSERIDSSSPTSHSGPSTASSSQGGDSGPIKRARVTQFTQWNLRFEELLRFKRKYGHCHVPNFWEDDQQLAHWVRRQRHQYRLKKERKHSTLSDKRQQILEQVGFVWDSHRSVWDERLEELVAFREDNGHCRVPRPYKQNPALAIWVKCQRRQYQLAQCGRKSSLTLERMDRLERLGFVWYARAAQNEA